MSCLGPDLCSLATLIGLLSEFNMGLPLMLQSETAMKTIDRVCFQHVPIQNLLEEAGRDPEGMPLLVGSAVVCLFVFKELLEQLATA